MKSLTLSAFCLALVALLGACGGSAGTLAVAGTISGYTTSGLVLQNGGSTLAVVANTSTFQMNDLIATNTPYNVVVSTQPAHAHCDVLNGSGKSGTLSITTVEINCVTDAYDLIGTISGLTGEGLILANGSNTVTIPANSTSFTMTHGQAPEVVGKVAWGSLYGVTVFQQPSGNHCSVASGSGTMLTNDDVTPPVSRASPVGVTCTTP